MVERWTLPFDFGGHEMTPAPGGEFVSYADYEAAKRKVAELEAERDKAIAMLETQAKLHRRAEAREARLSEALRGIADAIRDGLTENELPDHRIKIGEGCRIEDGFLVGPGADTIRNMLALMRDLADAALSGSGSGWRVIETDTPPHDVPVLLWQPPSMSHPNGLIEARPFSTGRSGKGWSEYSQHSWATHWMPLPASPSTAGER